MDLAINDWRRLGSDTLRAGGMLQSAAHEQLLLEVLQLQNPKEVVRLMMRSFEDGHAQGALLACISHPAMQAHANSEYLRQLLRAVFLAAERNGQELNDGLAGIQTSLLLEPPHEDAGSITLRLSHNLFEGSTGCHEWEPGFILAEFALSHTSIFRGKRCVELGCGAGTLGICLHRAGVRSVLLTDGDAQTLSNCRHNLELNGIALDAVSQVQVEELQWEEHRRLDADIVVGADLLYDPSAFMDLVLTLQATLVTTPARPGSTPRCAYFATTRRNEATLSAFLALLAPAQLKAVALQADAERGTADIRFRHHLALQTKRDSIVLHRISAINL